MDSQERETKVTQISHRMFRNLIINEQLSTSEKMRLIRGLVDMLDDMHLIDFAFAVDMSPQKEEVCTGCQGPIDPEHIYRDLHTKELLCSACFMSRYD